MVSQPVDPGRGEEALTGVRRVADHPVLATVALGVLVGVWNVVWTARHRDLGGFGVDESSYLADAWRYLAGWHHGGLGGLSRAVLDTRRTAPLMGLGSAVLMAVFGASLTVAVAVQAGFAVVAAASVASITSRLGSRTSALVAGIVTLGLPVLIIGSRYYQQSTPASAALALAVAALLGSRQGHRRPQMVLFGAAVGLLLLSRTMALAFVPGVAVAAALVLRRDRRTAGGLALAFGATLVVAGPWWLRHGRAIVGYLLGFGYGRGSKEITAVPLPLRVPIRLGLLVTDVRPALLLPALVVGIAAIVDRRRRRRALDDAAADVPSEAVDPTDRARWRAVAAVLGLGTVALISSSNLGSWFQMPLEVVAVAPVVAAGAHLRGRLRPVLGAVVVIAALANVVLTSNVRPGASTHVGGGTMSMLLFGGIEDSQSFDFEPIDPRFAAAASDGERRKAAREWTAAVDAVTARVEASRPHGTAVRVALFGENRFLRAGTFELRTRMQDRSGLSFEQADRPEDRVAGADPFAARVDGLPRVIVIVRSPHYLHDEVLDDPTWPAQARRRGWREEASVPLPDGGHALVFVHPNGTDTPPG